MPSLLVVWWHYCSVVAVHTSVVAAVVERGALLARRRHHSPLWVLDPPRSADLGSWKGLTWGPGNLLRGGDGGRVGGDATHWGAAWGQGGLAGS